VLWSYYYKVELKLNKVLSTGLQFQVYCSYTIRR